MKSTNDDRQKRSDEKRGVKVKGIKLHTDTIALLESLAEQTGQPQSAVVTKALAMFAESLKP
ncbi:hypothetical protein [Pantoea agglomerans]|jgi:predicted transcriptional regulator|uniref:hypothetical protein n=1 Tax=Enterobacter agglomerans TaxID=549 RepID=UPI001558D0C4|nr:hypothetical protein [Pantoea agglomerans]MBD8260504.1 hypothetical protein [Pantoea agglomerans]NQS80567.1 hypothetical protein [Pantoea agglomerans]